MSICTSSEECSGGSTLEKGGEGCESEGGREERERLRKEAGKVGGREGGREGGGREGEEKTGGGKEERREGGR